MTLAGHTWPAFFFLRVAIQTTMTGDVTTEKSVVFIRRGIDTLVFRHPYAGVQLPKGTVEPNETSIAAAQREVFEEVGVTLSDALVPLGTWVCPTPKAHWHVFVADAPRGMLETWEHAPTGGGEETGLCFDVFWITLGDARDVLHPLFWPVLDMMQRYVDLE